MLIVLLKFWHASFLDLLCWYAPSAVTSFFVKASASMELSDCRSKLPEKLELRAVRLYCDLLSTEKALTPASDET